MMIAGLIDPTQGRILFGGKDVTAISVERRNTAMVFQNYALWPHMTVGQNVEFGPKMRGVPAAQRRQIAEANLRRVEMENLRRRKPNQLSGGQQQRVALARALAAEPQCLLLDEPLSNLDARLRLHMRGELRAMVKASGMTAVYVTHDQKEALSMADRIAVMNQGRIVQVGNPQELYHRPATRFVADFLGEANFLEGRILPAGPGGAVRVGTGMGEILGEPAGSPPSGRVLCCIRPEHIEILPSGAAAGGKAVLPAEIRSETFLGETRQYSCSLADSSVWKVTVLARGGSVPLPGQKVQLAVGPADVTILAME